MPPDPSENPYLPPAADPLEVPKADSTPASAPLPKDPRLLGWAAVSFIEVTCLFTLGSYLQPSAPMLRVFFALGAALGWLGAAICYLMWVFRAADNARVIDRTGGPKPGWAVGCFFIPFINLVMPALVMKELADSTFKHRKVAGLGFLITVWWLSFVAMNLLGAVNEREVTTSALAAMWIAGMSIAVLILRISKRQAEFQWSDVPALSRPVMVPVGGPKPGGVPRASDARPVSSTTGRPPAVVRPGPVPATVDPPAPSAD